MQQGVGRAVLFVDFDNVYLGLAKVDQQGAEAFANHPDRWVGWLEEAAESGGPRRFLQKRVYLNPATHPRARAVFTRSGFRAVDCPSLTGLGKNSADIYMALDIMDALAQPHHTEYVILSGDADFTPVLHRIRAEDRTSTVVTGSPAAAAYRAVADRFIAPDELAAATADVSSPGLSPGSAEEGEASTSPLVTPPGDVDLEAVTGAILEVLRDSPKAVVGAAVAQAAINADPRIKSSDWLGTGSFKAFLARELPQLRYESNPPPGMVLDPKRHSLEGLQPTMRARLSPSLDQLCFVTGVPALSPEDYAALFRQLALVTKGQSFHITPASRTVRDEMALSGHPVGRATITFVIRGLAHAGVSMEQPFEAEQLSRAWADQVALLAAGAQVPLTADQAREVDAWLGVRRERS